MASKLNGKEAAGLLQPLLADLIALSLQAKQAHWNVAGPLFQPLHALFDGLAGSYRDWYDEVAERCLALGAPADGRLATVAKTASVADLPPGPLPGSKAVDLFLERVEGTIARARAGLARLGDLDLVSQDMVIGIVEGMEKQAWMLRVQQS